MHTRQLILALFLLLQADMIMAQTTGIITDNAGHPIAYANIGLPAKNLGTVSDEQGHYTLPPKGTTDTDKVRISFVGYQSQMMTMAQLAQHPNVRLLPRNNELKEVVVHAKQMKHHRLGNTAHNKNTVIGFTDYKLGYELGTVMNIRRHPTYIDSVQINMAQCTADSLFLRLNISEEIDGEFNNILTEPIYIRTSTKNALEHLSVDLTAYHLMVMHNFMVSVEIVKDLNGNEIFLCASMLGSAGYMRVVSQAPWTKISIAGPAISAYVTY